MISDQGVTFSSLGFRTCYGVFLLFENFKNLEINIYRVAQCVAEPVSRNYLTSDAGDEIIFLINEDERMKEKPLSLCLYCDILLVLLL